MGLGRLLHLVVMALGVGVEDCVVRLEGIWVGGWGRSDIFCVCVVMCTVGIRIRGGS